MSVNEWELEIKNLAVLAAQEWIDLYKEDEPEESYLHPMNDERFLWIVKEAYHETLVKNGLKSTVELKKPIDSVCRSFPADGLCILYSQMGLEGELLYIGKSTHVKQRHQVHRQKAFWWNKIQYLEFELYPDGLSLSEAERKAIKRYKPKYNTQHRVFRGYSQ